MMGGRGGHYQRAAMTPISEKDTIYEQTSKRTIDSGIKSSSSKFATPEEQKRTQMSSSGFQMTDERKLTGTGKYKFSKE